MTNRLICVLPLLLGAVGCKKNPAEPTQARSDAPNVLLLTIDTLRADRLPVYGFEGVRTPHIDALARDSLVFDTCQAHAPVTLPSHTSILTGLYPPQHGVRNNGTFFADAKLLTLPEVFKSAGYRTGGFVSAFVLDSRFGLDQGFDTYDDDLEDGRQRWSKFGVKDRRAENTVSSFLKWVGESSDQPFFSWVHLYDPHYEYDPPEPFRSQYPRDPYAGEIAYVDAQLGRLLGHLKSIGAYDNTIIVLTADHGESLGEHGESTHSLFVYESTQHVPLLIRTGSAASTRRQGLARHIDIFPTLLEAAQLRATKDEGPQRMGRSLLEDNPDAEILSYAESYLPLDQFGWAPLFSVRSLTEKYIEAPKPETYNLQTDPRELANIVHETSSPLEHALRKLRTALDEDAITTERTSMDDETEAKLRALGYVGDDSTEEAPTGRDPKDMLPIHEAREVVHRHMDRGAYEEAIPALERLQPQDPTNRSIVSDLASCHAELGHWDAAEKYYLKVREMAPQRLSAFTGLSKVYFKGKKDFDAAQRELDAAFVIAPHDPSLWGHQGDLFHERGEFEKAVGAYEKALQAGDQTPSYILGYASALNLVGRLKEARDAVERALRMEQDNAIGHYNHGVVLERMGLYAAAGGSFSEALRLQPDLHPAAIAYSKLLTRRGLFADAERVLRRGLNRAPETPSLLYELGSLYVSRQAAPQGVPLLEKAAGLRPSDPGIRTNLGVAYSQLEQWDRAYDQFQALRQALPQGSAAQCDAMTRLARVRVGQGRSTDAAAHLQDAVSCGGNAILTKIRRDPTLAPVWANNSSR